MEDAHWWGCKITAAGGCQRAVDGRANTGYAREHRSGRCSSPAWWTVPFERAVPTHQVGRELSSLLGMVGQTEQIESSCYHQLEEKGLEVLEPPIGWWRSVDKESVAGG